MRADPKVVRQIRRKASGLLELSDQQLRETGLNLKYQASSGEKLDRLMPLAFALVVEAARRTIEMTPYDVQLLGAIQMARGHVAEMKTGEGKTITATLPVYLHALTGQGAHVATVNDYLANRDFETMRPIYELLGMSVAVVGSSSTPCERKSGYSKDITYGTAKEFGFDFLRDRLSRLNTESEKCCQRKLNFVLVDEVDSILIDEARTPLIIGVVDSTEATTDGLCFRWAAKHANDFAEDRDYKYDVLKRKVELLAAGKSRLRSIPQTTATSSISLPKLQKHIEDAIKAERDFHRDKNYVIRDQEIAIVDEFTGRIAEGRQWQAGLHQAVEAKEQLKINPRTQHGATITLQSFFNRYKKFAGMTGTAWTSRLEFKRVFEKQVVRVPTHRPVNRIQMTPKVYSSRQLKVSAVVTEAAEMVLAGRAVLIGTRSIEKSEEISELLERQSIQHDVLNAKNVAQEASIVAQCGQSPGVTVATNMAGRGTDIQLSEQIREAGGLHVILTELHESQRIDWQLIGRGSRQGDPGSFRIFVSLDDEILLLGLGEKKATQLVSKFSRRQNELPLRLLAHFKKAQRLLERRYLTDRMILRRQDQDKHKQQFETGLDPYCQIVR